GRNGALMERGQSCPRNAEMANAAEGLPVLSAARSPLLLLLVSHQLATGSITFLRHFQKCHGGRFAARPGFFHHRIGNALCDLALLIDRAALEHCDLNKRHRVLSSQFSEKPPSD